MCRNDRLRQLHLRAYWSRPVQWHELQVLHGARDCPSAAPPSVSRIPLEPCGLRQPYGARLTPMPYGVVANANCA